MEKMELFRLERDVEGLGRAGDVLEVEPGAVPRPGDWVVYRAGGRWWCGRWEGGSEGEFAEGTVKEVRQVLDVVSNDVENA